MCIVLSKHSSDQYVLSYHDPLSHLAVNAYKDRFLAMWHYVRK